MQACPDLSYRTPSPPKNHIVKKTKHTHRQAFLSLIRESMLPQSRQCQKAIGCQSFMHCLAHCSSLLTSKAVACVRLLTHCPLAPATRVHQGSPEDFEVPDLNTYRTGACRNCSRAERLEKPPKSLAERLH